MGSDEIEMGSDEYKSIWQRRAERVGFYLWKGRPLCLMSDEEIKTAFEGLNREYGIDYIWKERAG